MPVRLVRLKAILTLATIASAALNAPARSDPLQTTPQPQAAPVAKRLGSIDVGTFENTIFYWHGVLLNLENIPCTYWSHAGVWDSSWGNHSYARVRELNSGRVITNISLTRGYGFVSAFPDYDSDTLWLFGTPADRCSGNGSPTTVQAWWTRDPALQTWNTALAFDYGSVTHNVQVTRVGPMGGASAAERTTWTPPAALPPHRYAMLLECFAWAITNGTDGNLTTGWTLVRDSRAPPGAPCGGPATYYSPTDGHYYMLSGGNTVHLYRSTDLANWTEGSPSPFLAPDEADAAVAPFSGFPDAAQTVGSPPNAFVGIPEPFPRRPFNPYWMGANWTAWVRNSNDADVCCMHRDVANASYVIWGASTQGRAPALPLTGTDAGTNAIAVAQVPLDALLASYFPA